MRSIRLYLALHAVCVTLLPGWVCAQPGTPTSALGEIPLPGGINAAAAALNDPLPPDRGQFLVEVIRRTYATPLAARTDPREAALRALLTQLDRARQLPSGSVPQDTVPLPLSPAIWIDVVFGGRTTIDGLAAAILQSRNASLFYSGLLALDRPTRDWIASQRNLISELASRSAPVFAVAAPGFRVSGGRVRVPGGARAETAWEAFVGRRVTEPADFLHALLEADEGRVAYVLTAMSELTPEQIVFALGGDQGDAPAGLRRLGAVFDRLAPGWKVIERTLWRPRRDPALLLSDLAVDEHGIPTLPGSRAFWTAVFAGEAPAAAHSRGADLAGDAADFPWLCDRIFSGTPTEQRRRYEAPLFASRVVKHVTGETAVDALEAVRMALEFPALAGVLERARIDDVAVYAAAGHRAAELSGIAHEQRRVRALAQFQGTLALLTRMESRGSVSPDVVQRAVRSLSELEPDAQGEYQGALVRWFADWIDSIQPNTPTDAALMQLLAGPVAQSARYVDWEGTRYKVDLTAAEAARLARLVGDAAPPYLSAARALIQVADAIEAPNLTKDALRASTRPLEPLLTVMGWNAADWQRVLFTAAERGDVREAARLAPRLRMMAADVWARGVVELTYVIAVGQPEHAAVSIADIARRHDFDLHGESVHTAGPWAYPAADVSQRGFHISGALLGLETALAEFSLTRVSTKAPPRKPTLSSEERAVFIATVPLVEPARLFDEDRDRIVAALQSGRARVAAVRTDEDASALAASIPLGPVRRTLYPWTVAHDPSRTSSFFSPLELLWVGLGKAPISPSFHGWGVLAQARLGCLCLQIIDRRPLEMLAGRVNAGILASGFPDLELRLAELLADLHMPAPLLAGVLASATFDFVNGAAARDEDDRRALVEFVLALRVDRVEEYLAMLTTGGPLVPPSDAADRFDGVAPVRRQR